MFSEDIKRQILICTPEKLSYPKERKEAFTERLSGLYELYTKEVRKGVAVERMEYLRGHTPPASKGSPFSLYDRYKREGNVKGMVTAKIEEFFSDMG